MNVPMRQTRNAPMRRLPASLRQRSCAALPLTLKCASVIVIASLEQRPRTHEDTPVSSRYTDGLSRQRGPAHLRPYNLHTAAP
jgi:hypothetical protein